MIVGLTGYAGSGKDTVGKILGHHGFTRVAFADALKALAVELNDVLDVTVDEHTEPFPARYNEIVGTYFGDLDTAKRECPAVRGYLQRLGVACRDIIGPDVWVDAANLDRPTDIVVTDVRFPNEANAIHMRKGVVLRVDRPGCGPVNGHASETNVATLSVDGVIENDGTLLDLEGQVARVLGYLNVKGVA